MWLFFILVLVPIIEIGLFIQVGGFIGLWPTLAIVIATAFAGTLLLRAQGTATLGKLQTELKSGQNPANSIAHGALILISGIVLLTPGFFTDAIGILLLLPPIRVLVIAWGKKNMVNATIYTHGMGNDTPRNPDIMEGEFTVEEPNENTSKGDSGWTKLK